MLQPGRNYNADRYRYSYNGKPDDNEVAGWQDYGFREYDRRINRFISVDPLTNDYPWYTPYQFAGNNPIQYLDIDGLEPYAPVEQWKTVAKPVVFKDKQVANLVYCHAKNKSFWVVKQGKNYLYNDSKKGWVQFHAYTEAEIRNSTAQAAYAFSDIASKTVANTLITMATVGSVGLGSTIMEGTASILAKNSVGALSDFGNQMFDQLKSGNVDMKDLNLTTIGFNLLGMPSVVTGAVGAYGKLTIKNGFIDYSKENAFRDATIDAVLGTAGEAITDKVNKIVDKKGLNAVGQQVVNAVISVGTDFAGNGVASEIRNEITK